MFDKRSTLWYSRLAVLIIFPSTRKSVECKAFSPDKLHILQEVQAEARLTFQTNIRERNTNKQCPIREPRALTVFMHTATLIIRSTRSYVMLQC